MNSTRQQIVLLGCTVLAALMLAGTGTVSAAVITVDDSGSADYVCMQTAEVAE